MESSTHFADSGACGSSLHSAYLSENSGEQLIEQMLPTTDDDDDDFYKNGSVMPFAEPEHIPRLPLLEVPIEDRNT